jgi:hypothetical protein
MVNDEQKLCDLTVDTKAVRFVFWQHQMYQLFFFVVGSWVNLDGSIRNGNSVHHSPTGSQAGAMEDLLAEAVVDHYKQNSKLVFSYLLLRLELSHTCGQT